MEIIRKYLLVILVSVFLLASCAPSGKKNQTRQTPLPNPADKKIDTTIKAKPDIQVKALKILPFLEYEKESSKLRKAGTGSKKESIRIKKLAVIGKLNRKIVLNKATENKYKPQEITNARKQKMVYNPLFAEIYDWLGVPYRFGGCSLEKGIDCSCLVKLIYKNVYGVDLHRVSRDIYRKDLMPVSRKNLRAGDILVFKMEDDEISHVGIYLKNNWFVHASSSRGVVVDDLTKNYYKKRFVAAGRVDTKPMVSVLSLAMR